MCIFYISFFEIVNVVRELLMVINRVHSQCLCPLGILMSQVESGHKWANFMQSATKGNYYTKI